jgi:hypothetical protein
MGIFYTENTTLGIFWSALEWNMLLYLIVIWNTLQLMVYFMAIW